MSKSLEELREEATELGIKFQKNIGAEKLEEKIEEYYAELDTDGKDAVIAEAVEEVVEDAPKKGTKASARIEALRVIKEQEKANRETKVVKLAMVDRREASNAVSAYFSTGATAMRVPLDEWVEMPFILIEQAEKAQAMVHMERDGITVHKMQKKYVVEYK